jgi:hypothetical protein
MEPTEPVEPAEPVKKPLGQIITWDVPTGEVAYVKVLKGLEDAGLNPEEAKELSHRSAFNRACKTLKTERSIDKVGGGAKSNIFQFTRKELEDGKIEFDYECQVELDLESGKIECPEDGVVEQQAQELIAYAHQVRTGQDITCLVQRLFRNSADMFPVNPNKGVAYFVPIEHEGFVEMVDKFLHSIGGSLCRFYIQGDPKTKLSVQDSINAGLNTLTQQLNETVEGWNEKTRESTFERAKENWKRINAKVHAYAGYLGDKQAEMQENLLKAQRALQARILELHPEPEETSSAA